MSLYSFSLLLRVVIQYYAACCLTIILVSIGRRNLVTRIADGDAYHINLFLVSASERVPRSVVSMLLDRIADGQANSASIQPLPYFGFNQRLEGIQKSGEYRGILRQIREKSLDNDWH